MARLGPIGLNQLLTDIKNWVNSKLSNKADTAHTHTAYAVKHTYTTAANAAKNWYRIANANTKQVYTGNPIHAEFILTAYNSSYDPGYSERWYVRAMVLGRNAHVVIFGSNSAPFSQCRVLYENTLADIDDNDRPAIDIYLNYVLANGTTKIEIEEVYNQGWTFVADGQLAVSTVPTGFENTAVGVRGNGVERSSYSDIATYLNKPRRDITSNVTLADNTTYRSTTLNCTGTRTITIPSINSNYFWCVIKNFNAEADIITIHPSTTSVLIDGSNDDIILRPGEFVAIHSRAANSFSIVGDNRKRTCLVGRSGEVGTDTKHWFRVAQKTLNTRYRDAFILLDVFQAASDSSYMGRLCAHVRVDNTIGVVGNKQFTWLYRGTQLSDTDFAMTTIETSGTSVVVDIWCKRTGGYSAFAFAVVSEGFSTDSLDSPAGKWILTRERATVGDLESLDTGFTTVTNPTVVTLANSITGTSANVTGTVAIANGGTGATTRLDAVKALTNESVASPTHFLTITTNWGKAGYTRVSEAKTALGITGDIGSHSDSEYVHMSGDETIGGNKTFSDNITLSGTYLGTEASGNERTNIYLLANRDTAGTSGAYIGRFRQNRTQGAMESSDVSFISFDFLENSTRYTRCFTMGMTDWDNDKVPQTYYLTSPDGKGSLGTATTAWNKVYANSYYLGTTSFTDKFVTTDTAQTITGVKTFNSDTLQGNAYRIANSAGTGYGVFQRTDGTYWYFMVTANNDPLGSWTSARPITIRLSDGYCTINGKANEANKVYTTIAADTTAALVQASVASNDCFRIAAGGAANAGWAEIATGDDASEPIYVRQYKGNFTTLQRTATLLDGSGNTSFPGTVTATGFSGPLTGNVTGTASKATGNANGNEITDTVIKGLSISGKTITYTKIDGNTGTLTTQDTVYTHPTTSGNKHIPSGGSSGQFLGWDSDGTAKWVNNPNTNTDTLMTQNVSTTDSTYPILLCATANATSNQGAKTGIFGSGVKVNPKTSVVSAKGFSGIPTGNTYVTAVKDGGALVNSQATSWGAIWRAPTKDYQVAGATWSNTNNNVYICYSVTNANANAGTNTMAKSLVWAADTGTLTTTTFSGALSGNASTATEFSANKDVTLTGDVTGTASSKAGWSVATTLANSGVTAGTYGPDADVTGNNNATISVPEITVDSKGRVTSVTNRTLTCKNNTYNVYNKTLTIQKNGTNVATFTSNSNTNVTANITVPTKTSELTNDSNFLTTSSSLNASKLTGTIDIARLPQGALERVITVADQTARFALTTSSVQLGDTVKQLDTGVMYVVVNESKLNSNDGYLEYTAGSASSVPWSGITSKPTEFTPSSHTHTKSEITDFPTNVSAFTNDAGYLTAHQSLSNYVTLNTAQEITNTKTFKDANTVVKRTDIEAGNTLPSADKLARNIFQDKNGKELGSIFYYKNTSGNTGLCLRAGDWFSESEGVYSLNASGTNRRAELVLYTNSSGDCCIQPNGLFSTHIKPLNSSVYLGDSTKSFGRVYANDFKSCNAGLLPDTDVQTTEEHSIGFYGQNNTPLSYITFQKRPNLKDRVAIRINTTSSSYKSYDFDATCFYPESSNSVDIGSTTNIFKNIYCNNYYKGTTAFGDIVTHNASEFLTSHQSLSNYVTLNGAQTISGIKTISTHLRFSSANTRGTAPSANEERDLIDYKDSAGNRISLFETMYNTDKSSKTSIYAYKTTAATGGNIGSMGIGCNSSGNVYTFAPTPASLDNSTKIATTAFVYNTAAKHLSAATNIYVAMVATGNGSGSNTSNYMALADLRTYLATVHMHSAASSINGSYNLQILFKAGDSFGDATFDATKMPGVRNLILNTSAGTNSTVNNYSTNSPTFGNINVTGDIVVTMRNLNCTGRISSQYGAQVSIDTYMGISSLMAANSGYLNVAKNMVINVCDAHVDYLFLAMNNGILAMWPGATVTINFRQQCYYARALFYTSSNGTAWIGYSSFKLTGTEPMAVWGGSGTLTGTSNTAAATVEKAVTLASGQTFTLTTNATAKVKFTVDNTANNPTLNIGGTGAKPIYWNNAPVQATMLMKNITYDVKYNGSQFVIQNAVKRLTNNDFGVFRSSGNYNQTYNSGSWNFTGWALYYGTGIENSNWRGSHIGNIQQNVSTSNNTYPVLISGTANATATTSTAPCFAKDVKINPSTNVVSASGFDGPLTWSGTAFSYIAGNSLYYYSGQPAIANCFEGSSNDFTKFSYPAGGTSVSSSNANIQTLRLDWGNTYWHDLFMSPNNNYLWHRNVVNSDARGWRRIVEENVTGLTDQSWNINIAGTAANVTGTVAIANGGTGATTRLTAVKALTNEAVASPTHFLAITTNWGKAGYTTVAQAKTVLGITGDIVSHNASEFLTSHQSLSSCVKNVVTNNQTIKSTGITRGTAPSSAQTFGIAFSDNNNKSIGNIYGQYATDKSTYVGLYAYKGTTTSNGDNASVRVGYDASGNAYTYAPTPATADNSTQIATTAFVKAQGYLTSHQSLANYVTTNTDQSISGIKSHSKHISILGDYIGNESSTNGRSCLYLKANRDTDGKSGLYVTKFRQNVAQGSMGSSDVVFLSHDILENETRTNAGFVESYSNWENDVPGGMSIYSTIATRNLGTSAKPWTNAYITNLNLNGNAFDPTSIDGVGTTRLLAYEPASTTDLSNPAGTTKSGSRLYDVRMTLPNTSGSDGIFGNAYQGEFHVWIDTGRTQSGTWKVLHDISVGTPQTGAHSFAIAMWVRIA